MTLDERVEDTFLFKSARLADTKPNALKRLWKTFGDLMSLQAAISMNKRL